MIARRKFFSPLAAIGLLVATAGLGLACQVPVFRYALERWSPEQYRVLVLSAGPISDDDPRLALQSAKSSPLIQLTKIEITQSADQRALALWKQFRDESNSPLVVTLYPEKATELRDQVAFVSPLADNTLANLAASPVRSEIAKRLTSGQSAVWLLLESGDTAKDQRALLTLNQQLSADSQWLKLPTAEELEVEPDFLDQVKVKLAIGFSVISIRRDDPQEQFLVNALLNSEPDLRDFDEPIAFPVFGRGLVLYALVGQGIAPDTIRAASAFISGPCSCQVKEQNPGFDLLIDFDWNQAVGDALISQPAPGTPSTPKLLAIPPGRNKK